MTNATHLLLGCALAALLAAPALAQTGASDVWDDPTLADAARDANLIVLAECTGLARGGGASYKVLRTFKGAPRDGKEILIAGLEKDPERPDQAAVDVGEQAYLVLNGEPDGHIFTPPTPTWGRFPIKSFEEREVIAALTSTFVRVPIPLARWERILTSVATGAPAPGVLEEARAALALPRADLDAITDIYVGLEVLSLYGVVEDMPAVMRVAKDARFQEQRQFQVRVAAARALGRIAGPSVVAPLLEMVEKDPVDVVQSTAAIALGDVLEPIARAGGDEAGLRAISERLATFALGASSTDIQFAAATDPRKNIVASPLAAVLQTLARVRARSGVTPALRALERPEDGNAIVAGLAYFTTLRDRSQALAIATRMRPPGAEDVIFNRLFARALKQLTDQELGEDREAWLRWCRAQAVPTPDGPIGPPPQPQQPNPPPGGGPGR